MKKYIADEPTILEIIKFVKWEDVKKSMEYHYPETKGNYRVVFEGLKTFRKRKHKDPNEKIEIESINEAIYYEDPDMWAEGFSVATNKYSTSFRRWRELANIQISKHTIRHYIFTDIIAHFIWEITWYGSEEDSLMQGRELQKLSKELTNKINKKNGQDKHKTSRRV